MESGLLLASSKRFLGTFFREDLPRTELCRIMHDPLWGTIFSYHWDHVLVQVRGQEYGEVGFKARPPVPLKTDNNKLIVHPRYQNARPSTYTLLMDDSNVRIKPIFYNLKSGHNFEMALLHRLNLDPTHGIIDNSIVSQVATEIIDDIGLKPIQLQNRADIRTWIEHRPYTRARKTALLNVLSRISDAEISRMIFPNLVKCFIKDETYGKLKPPRLIASRVDEAKVLLGPYFHHIDEALFNSIYSVKHIPYSQRPTVIEERFSKYHKMHYRYLCLDYTSFECSANRDMQLAFEYVIYRRIFPSIVYSSLVTRLLSNKTRLTSYGLGCASISTVRFSGEMNTSCGNTLYNLMAIKYCLRIMGIKTHMLVEGDDSIVAIPQDFDIEYFLELMHSCGLIVKYDIFDYHGDAGYCSSYWSFESSTPVMDLKEFCLNIGVCPTHRAKRFGKRTMIDSKLTSYAIQYPHNPLVLELFKLYECNGKIIEPYNSYRYEELAKEGNVILRGNDMHAQFKVEGCYTHTDLIRLSQTSGVPLNILNYSIHLIRKGKPAMALQLILHWFDNASVLDVYRPSTAVTDVPSKKS